MTVVASTSHLTKTYSGKDAVRDVSLDIRAGECVGFLGPNGAGKTTLLSIIEGLRAPTSGSVALFGGDPRDASSRVLLGATPQATALPEALKVGETIDFVAAHYPAPASRDALVEEFGLGDFVGKQCGSLSGGQQRRVAVALAFVGNPQLVLLDEPTTGLDVDARRTLWDAVRARHAAGTAIVITSHHLEEIEQLAERVIVIDNGTVRADDSLEAIIDSVSRHRLTVRDVPESVITAVDPDATISLNPDTGVLTAVVSNSDDVVRAIVASGTPFRSLTVRGATLEEAFLTLTNGASA